MKLIRLFILLLLTVLAFEGLLKQSHVLSDIDIFGGDFGGYWASCHLLLKGDDPYASDEILSVQKSLGWTNKEPTLIYNPPWVFTFLIPFSSFSFATDRIIWMIVMLTLTIFSADRLWVFYGGSPQRRMVALIVMATFVPLLLDFKLGQIVPLMLPGLLGFQYFVKKEKWWLAGMATVLFTVKPHILYLFWFALLLWGLKNRLWPVLTGSTLMLLIVMLIPLFYNPEVYQLYFSNIVTKSYTLHWATPTLGTFLRLYFGAQHEWLQYISMLAGLIWFLAHWCKYKNTWIWEEQIHVLILVSLMTNFYTWAHDYLLLLPAIIQTTVKIYRNQKIRQFSWTVLLYIILNIFGLLLTFIGSHWWILMPYALWGIHFYAQKHLDAANLSEIKHAEFNAG